MLQATDVGKDFASVTALDSVSLQVQPGEALSLLGANGAGKSTMMNLFLGFLRPDRGQLSVCDIDPAKDPSGARRCIAYIPEQVALYENMSGLENLEYFDQIAGHRRESSALREFLEQAGLTASQAQRRVSSYSKGMRQKVGLAIAAAKDAKVLLLDEPMSGLDPSAARDFSSRLNDFRQEGKAILMATHDIFRAKECSSRIGIMRSGELVDFFDPEQMDAIEIENLYLRHMSKEAVTA